jgi:hypothetical protein
MFLAFPFRIQYLLEEKREDVIAVKNGLPITFEPYEILYDFSLRFLDKNRGEFFLWLYWFNFLLKGGFEFLKKVPEGAMVVKEMEFEGERLCVIRFALSGNSSSTSLRAP